jgi:hypothetical protein
VGPRAIGGPDGRPSWAAQATATSPPIIRATEIPARAAIAPVAMLPIGEVPAKTVV